MEGRSSTRCKMVISHSKVLGIYLRYAFVQGWLWETFPFFSSPYCFYLMAFVFVWNEPRCHGWQDICLCRFGPASTHTYCEIWYAALTAYHFGLVSFCGHFAFHNLLVSSLVLIEPPQSNSHLGSPQPGLTFLYITMWLIKLIRCNQTNVPN